MRRDPLKVLKRVQDAAVAQASRDAAAARAVLQDGEARAGSHAQRVRAEQASLQPGHEAAVFAAWLPRARAEAAALADRVASARTRADASAQMLLERRMAAEAVLQALAKRQAAARVDAARRGQAAMDEAAGNARLLREPE